ncbi:MAG TPA: amidophosphoribosyltransferase [Acidimicrobiales bacterium]|nr:amidophosphoribosyltransferase [Acidimicrobiales bacterium]
MTAGEDQQGDGKPREACGVFGVLAPGNPVAHLTYDGLFALQHRGQESAGMAVSDGRDLMVVKDMGLVTNVFNEYKLASLEGHLAIGHTRYSTTGASTWHNAQPVYRAVGERAFALGHNGNLTNTRALAEEAGMLPGASGNDSDLIAELIARRLEEHSAGDHPDDEFVDALVEVLPKLQGAFSLVACTHQRLIGVRDPNGFRPLVLGRLDDDGWVLASETPALDIAGAHYVRDVQPGEVLVLDADGPRSLHPWPAEVIEPKLCIFEFVYLARPDSRLYGQELQEARIRMGELLATQAPVEADAVIGVPDSGLPAAEGYARRSGIPYATGLVRNRYIGRTFITPGQSARDRGVRRKLNPLRSAIEGKRLVVVDDSMVRGTTTRALIRMLREAGAREVHLRISSPPYRWPCFYGLDTGTRSQLIAASLEVGEICDYVGADSLSYLSLEALKEATGAPGAGFCDACLTGHYPVPVELSAGARAGGEVISVGGVIPVLDEDRLDEDRLDEDPVDSDPLGGNPVDADPLAPVSD